MKSGENGPDRRGMVKLPDNHSTQIHMKSGANWPDQNRIVHIPNIRSSLYYEVRYKLAGPEPDSTYTEYPVELIL